MSERRSWTRREFIKHTSAGVALLPPALRADAPKSSEAEYLPLFFTRAEWNFVNAAVDRLIPAGNGGAGGLEACVPEFLDRQLESPYGYGAFAYTQGPFLDRPAPELGYQLSYTPRELYRVGIAAADVQCRKLHGAVFSEFEASRQEEFLTQLEHGAVELGRLPSRAFFEQLLANVKEGYFADPIYGGNRHMGGWKLIGFPGARADFTDWIDQPGKRYPYGPVSIAGASKA